MTRKQSLKIQISFKETIRDLKIYNFLMEVIKEELGISTYIKNLVLEDMKKSERKFYFFHIELKDSHKQVGSVGYTVTDNTPVGKMVHAGYFIYPTFWGYGYTTEAFKKVLEFAFSENNVYRVSTGCLAENIASERVMQKCGLKKEAEHLDYEWHDGKMKTRLEYRLLKSEW